MWAGGRLILQQMPTHERVGGGKVAGAAPYGVMICGWAVAYQLWLLGIDDG
jgi:hypothetical protein